MSTWESEMTAKEWQTIMNRTEIVTVITGNFGVYHYEIVGDLTEEPDTYSGFNVFVNGDCITLDTVCPDETDALLYFMNWVADALMLNS